MIIVFLSCDFLAQERSPSGGFSGREATGGAERPGRNNSTTSKVAINSNQGRATYEKERTDATSIRIFKHEQYSLERFFKEFENAKGINIPD